MSLITPVDGTTLAWPLLFLVYINDLEEGIESRVNSLPMSRFKIQDSIFSSQEEIIKAYMDRS